MIQPVKNLHGLSPIEDWIQHSQWLEQERDKYRDAFTILHNCVLKYANEDAWTGQFSKDGRQDLWLYGDGKATAVKALKEIDTNTE